MKKINILFFSAAFLTITSLTSCSIFSKSYVANYSVGLSSVESPVNAKQQFGETKVVTFDENGINKYRYEDDYINITWYVSPTRFNFELKNKSDHTIKINWDDISYVDINGEVSRMMHAGVKYSEKNDSQPSTTIPRDASISDILIPTDNVYYRESIGWDEKYLIPCVYNTSEDFNAINGASAKVGKTLKVLMPIMIENIQNDYTFKFNIDKLLNTSDKKKK